MTVNEHFEKADASVHAVYDPLLATVRTHGPVAEDVKKTSIHLVRQTAFAGVAVRRSSIILTLKSRTDIRHARIMKREQVSANRWHLEVRLETPACVDRQLVSWLRSAYEIAGPPVRTSSRSR